MNTPKQSQQSDLTQKNVTKDKNRNDPYIDPNVKNKAGRKTPEQQQWGRE